MNECIDHGYRSTRDGYAQVRMPGRKLAYRHRVAYCQANGASLEDLGDQIVRHKCDNPRCINPEHLELGSRADNANDMVSRGRARHGTRHPQMKITPEDAKRIREEFTPRCPTKGRTALAKQYNVHPNTIMRIVKGIHYTDRSYT